MVRKIFITIFCCFFLMSTPVVSSEAKGFGYYGKADSFTLMSVQGEEVSLETAVKSKKYTLLVFLRFDDPACRQEAKRIAKFYSEKGSFVKVIGIDIMENKTIAKNNIDKLGLNFPVLLDLDGTVANIYAIRGLPTLILLDNKMEILYATHKIFAVEKTLDAKGIR